MAHVSSVYLFYAYPALTIGMTRARTKEQCEAWALRWILNLIHFIESIQAGKNNLLAARLVGLLFGCHPAALRRPVEGFRSG